VFCFAGEFKEADEDVEALLQDFLEVEQSGEDEEEDDQ
jgi:hypothetical protein